MISRIVWGKLKPGVWDEFSRVWREYGNDISNAPGFRGRMLTRDRQDESASYSISFWDSIEAYEAFKPTPYLRQLQGFFAEPFMASTHDLSVSEVPGLD